jgi:hypothetical protein
VSCVGLNRQSSSQRQRLTVRATLSLVQQLTRRTATVAIMARLRTVLALLSALCVFGTG